MRGERGSVTVVAAAMMAIVAVLTLACADLAHVLVARANAQSAADAAALAAVQELALPSGSSACALAAEYASRNAASLETCDPGAASAEVFVEVAVAVGPTLLFGDGRTAHAQARAVFGVG